MTLASYIIRYYMQTPELLNYLSKCKAFKKYSERKRRDIEVKNQQKQEFENPSYSHSRGGVTFYPKKFGLVN